MGRIDIKRIDEVKNLYNKDQLCMREIGERLGVPIDAVIYFMRKNGLKRRSFSEIDKIRFDNKPLSFKIKKLDTKYLRDLKTIGLMLYWGEGYKSDNCKVVDLANSNPDMILVFTNFLRKIYGVDEKRLRIYLYCHANQDYKELTRFWSKLTKVPESQFSKPYIRSDFREDGRKMEHGLVHVRYSDKKLFLEIMKAINFYKNKYIK